jgi:hypothetical protein
MTYTRRPSSKKFEIVQVVVLMRQTIKILTKIPNLFKAHSSHTHTSSHATMCWLNDWQEDGFKAIRRQHWAKSAARHARKQQLRTQTQAEKRQKRRTEVTPSEDNILDRTEQQGRRVKISKGSSRTHNRLERMQEPNVVQYEDRIHLYRYKGDVNDVEDDISDGDALNADFLTTSLKTTTTITPRKNIMNMWYASEREHNGTWLYGEGGDVFIEDGDGDDYDDFHLSVGDLTVEEKLEIQLFNELHFIKPDFVHDRSWDYRMRVPCLKNQMLSMSVAASDVAAYPDLVANECKVIVQEAWRHSIRLSRIAIGVTSESCADDAYVSEMPEATDFIRFAQMLGMHAYAVDIMTCACTMP